MDKERLLLEIDSILRDQPDPKTITHYLSENHAWFGRVVSVIKRWDEGQASLVKEHQKKMNNALFPRDELGYIISIIHAARFDVLWDIPAESMTKTFDAGRVFDYFERVRDIIKMAAKEVFFIDPYLDDKFVSTYIPHIKNGVKVRVLCGDKRCADKLVPAIELCCYQYNLDVEVVRNDFHDRFLVVDNNICYSSGASFKDGGRKSPAIVAEIKDISATIRPYEELWSSGEKLLSKQNR